MVDALREKTRGNYLALYQNQQDVQTYSNPITGPEGSRKLMLPDFQTIGT
jgi:hypothetical protein